MTISARGRDILWDIERKARMEVKNLGITYKDAAEGTEHYEKIKATVYTLALQEVKTSGVKLSYAKGDDGWKATCISINIGVTLDGELKREVWLPKLFEALEVKFN